MPVYHFTYHGYRTWNADHPKGYVRRGVGILPPDEIVARQYDARASDEPVLFRRRHQRVIAWIVCDACRQRDWRLHQIATETTHFHALVSWRDSQSWEDVRAKLKNLVSWALSKEFNTVGRPWLVRSASRKRVRDCGHFTWLMDEYFPGHRGLRWREGDAAPEAPTWAAATARGYPPK
jgi:hypothetical protein